MKIVRIYNTTGGEITNIKVEDDFKLESIFSKGYIPDVDGQTLVTSSGVRFNLSDNVVQQFASAETMKARANGGKGSSLPANAVVTEVNLGNSTAAKGTKSDSKKKS